MGDGRDAAAVAVWHDRRASSRSCSSPMVVLLVVAAHPIIVLLFTRALRGQRAHLRRCRRSILLSPSRGRRGAARPRARRASLFGLNLVRLALIASIIPLVARVRPRGRGRSATVLAAAAAKALASSGSRRSMRTAGLARSCPGAGLARIAAAAVVAAVAAALAVRRSSRRRSCARRWRAPCTAPRYLGSLLAARRCSTASERTRDHGRIGARASRHRARRKAWGARSDHVRHRRDPGASEAARCALRRAAARCAATLAHRGPDDEGSYLDASVGLGMRRLSIIDLGRAGSRSATRTARSGSSSTARSTTTASCAASSRRAATASATTQRHRGHRPPLRGARAALRRRAARHVRLRALGRAAAAAAPGPRPARDQAALLRRVGGRLLFGSELKALLAAARASSARLDWARARPPPDLPGDAAAREHRRRGAQARAGPRPRWPRPGRRCASSATGTCASSPTDEPAEAELVERLRELLEESVRSHLVSDVPLGAFLSGGIDSSAVVAHDGAARGAPGQDLLDRVRRGRTSTSRLRAAGRAGLRDRAPRADPRARRRSSVARGPSPGTSTSRSATPRPSRPTWCRRLAAEHVKVVLSGDGGDELFAGYDQYVVEGRERARTGTCPAARARAMRRGRRAALPRRRAGPQLSAPHRARPTPTATSTRSRSSGATSAPRCSRPEACATGRRATIPGGRARGGCSRRAGALARRRSSTRTSTRYLPLDILTKVDRMSMAHSIEARVPLLDHSWSSSRPRSRRELQLRDGDHEVPVQARACAGVLPDAILDRPKRGFAIPLGRWFRGPLARLRPRSPAVRDRASAAASSTPGRSERLAGAAASAGRRTSTCSSGR